MIKLISYLFPYVSMGFNIFIFCYIGEIVTEQCKLVGEVAYMTDWYYLHHTTARGLILIIVRSNNVVKITAGKLFHLSIATFGDAKNSQQKLNPMLPLINRFMSSMHYWVLLKRTDDIQKLIRHMETDWNLVQRIGERKVMLQHAKFGRFVTIICGIMMQGSCLLFGLGQSMRTATITIGNETFTTRSMTCPIYSKIIDTRFTPQNEIAVILQQLVILVISTCTVGGCSLAAVFAIHACGQLNVLYLWLHELIENQTEKNDKSEQKLAAIVEHHLRILSFISQLESIMHKPAFVELTGCTTIMCLLGYYTATVRYRRN
ncbi:PREDICTED: uncharacterized protein LOC105626542 [Atta cephalotes]|uniref:Odorant receptor n=1 Tax=Atta cephalotes TaxID=12957 RepID=A0A158P0C2_ATTCE|nr:PREDICTED: uncharacterized protein LOC105626542 [Atta cephalotes]